MDASLQGLVGYNTFLMFQQLLMHTFLVAVTAFTIFVYTSMLHDAFGHSQKSLVSLFTAVNPLIGSKLYDVAARSLIDCQSTCLSEDSCTMVTYNANSQACSLFTVGTTSYSIVDPVFFVESKQSMVSYTLSEN